MSHSDGEIDVILDFACYYDQMTVTKMQWFGPNVRRRFRACWDYTCGYHVWIDEEPMGAHTLEIIKELQERALEREAKWKVKLTRYIGRHEVEMAKVKKKQQVKTVGMFSLVSVIMNMSTYTMNDDSIGDIEDCDELDL